jgi:hypothetical protein
LYQSLLQIFVFSPLSRQTVMIQKARFPSVERQKTCFFDHFSKEKAKYPSADRPFLASMQTSGRIITVRPEGKKGQKNGTHFFYLLFFYCRTRFRFKHKSSFVVKEAHGNKFE